MRREREGKEENDEAGAQAEAGADAPSHFSSRYTSISGASAGSIGVRISHLIPK